MRHVKYICILLVLVSIPSLVIIFPGNKYQCDWELNIEDCRRRLVEACGPANYNIEYLWPGIIWGRCVFGEPKNAN